MECNRLLGSPHFTEGTLLCSAAAPRLAKVLPWSVKVRAAKCNVFTVIRRTCAGVGTFFHVSDVISDSPNPILNPEMTVISTASRDVHQAECWLCQNCSLVLSLCPSLLIMIAYLLRVFKHQGRITSWRYLNTDKNWTTKTTHERLPGSMTTA